MTEFTVCIAGKAAAVTALFASTRAYCADYLCEGNADFCIEISMQDIAFERRKSMQEDALEGKTPRSFSDAYLEVIAVQRRLAEKLFDFDTLLFHGSVVAVDGQGYLFTAKSGTGKSTHTRLWRQVFGERAVMINDDKPFLHVSDQGVMVYGSPWNGKHKLGENACVPLKAICLLERGEMNQIQPIDAKDALTMLFQQSNRPMTPVLMPKYLELLDGLSKQTAFYRMKCNMEPEAALTAYQAMCGKDEQL